jgi:hypothetical protein
MIDGQPEGAQDGPSALDAEKVRDICEDAFSKMDRVDGLDGKTNDDCKNFALQVREVAGDYRAGKGLDAYTTAAGMKDDQATCETGLGLKSDAATPQT